MDKIHRNSLAAALCAAFLFLMSFSSFGQNIIYSCDFEDDAENAGWTLVNDDQTNQWYIGSAASNGGSNGLYITNDGGATNEYTFDDVELTVYAYRTIEITENTICNVSFDWMSEGEFYNDYALAFIIPNGSDFSDFNNVWIDDYDRNSLYDVPSGWIYISNSIMNGVSSWQNSTRRIVLAQGTYNLVFFWKNNESDGENPPVAIDNISIIKEAPATLPYTCDFENATENGNWILANCDYYNGWYIGSGASNGGSKGLYISNDQGTTNSADYDDTYVYAYREINTSETGEYLIDFDWRAVGATNGEGYCLLRSFLVPTTLPSNLNECDYNSMSYDYNTTPSGWIDASSSENGLMYGQSSWQHSSKVLSIDAGTYYLVFFWKNNSDHIDPPAAVDNISISRVVNPAVATSSVSNLGASSVTLNGEILNQGASDITERGFMYGTSSGNLSNTLPSTDNTDAFSYELTGLTENTTYYYRAYATNSDGTGYGVVKSFKTLNTLNDHIFVDLGLPSGLLWATTNVGANSPEDSGDYFSWGETTPKGLYSLENYKYSNSESELLTKYCDNSQYGHDGFVDNLSTLEASDDAATANWGAGWHMPSVSEFEELMDNCTLTWTTQNGATGYLFTGSNGSSIFMPAAGYRNDDDLLTGHGEYWARTNVSTLPNYANYLGFYEDNPFTDYESRHFGYSVRPVLTASPTVETNSATDVESSTATLQGKILLAEGATISNRGFSFGTDSDNLTQNFTSPDNTDYFTYTISDLNENTTYYFKAYATINGETKYGEVKSFTTVSSSTSPAITITETQSPTDITSTSAKITVLYDNPEGLPIVRCGFKYNTSAVSLTINAEAQDMDGSFFAVLTNLDPGTTYYYKAYIEHTNGTVYGNVMSFQTLEEGTGDGFTFSVTSASCITSEDAFLYAYLSSPSSIDEQLITEVGFICSTEDVDDEYAQGSVYDLGGSSAYIAGSAHNLISASEYECKPYIVYNGVTYYGESSSFFTEDIASVWTDTEVATVDGTSAILSGSVEDVELVTEYGFFISPDVNDVAGESYRHTVSLENNEFSIEVSGLLPNTTYFYVAYAISYGETVYGWVRSLETGNGTNTNNDYEYVDLGLPSGIKWANMNIGATQPSDFGNRYAWGETTPKDVNSYSWENYIHCAGTNNDLTKYCFSSIWGHNDYTDELTTLEATDDAATVNWGEGWRMPTDEECQELYNNCSASWDTQNGVVGVTLTSRSNGNSIFIPIDPEENYGTHYWSSSFGTDDDDPTMGKTLYLNASNQIVSSGGDQRNRPNAIRPVYVQSNTANNNNNTFTDDRDGQTYKFVTIGNQIWMAENLRYNNNLTVDTEGETSDTDPYIYYPDGNVANFGTYGYLYNWPAAMNGDESSEANPSGVQGICPNGWHLPSEQEWVQLKDYLGGEYSAAKLAGRTDLWDSDAGESDYLITESEYFGTTGFNALPAGERRGTSYYDINRLASFWTATEESSSSYAYIRDIHNYSFEIYEDNHDKSWARSIRCVKNAETVFHGNFEDADENANWTLANGNQTNQWYIGTATNNGGNYSLYISSDGGASNGYDYTSASNVYAYYTLEISETADYNITFDWSAKANSLVAFLAPSSSEQQPLAGTLLTDTPDDWILIGAFSNEDSWQSFSKRMYINEGDYYFILYWTNSENDGNNPPPAAVDNIVINKAPQVITDTFVDARDGQSYSYVNIGSQTWMSENLRFVGDIPIGTETSETVAYRYIPNGDNANVATYGYLYNWPAAMNGEESSSENPSGVHGICPEGWHLPSEQEWVQLFDYLGGTQNAGSMLAGRSDLWGNGDLTQSQNFGTTGFNAMPAGNYAGSAQNFGSIARFWTTTEMSNSAYYKEIRSNYTDIYSDAQGKDFGNSVRCVKNAYPTANNYQCGFDDDAEFANWTIQGVNSGQPNYWTIGMTEQGEPNLNSLFITDGGGNYSYTNSSTSAVYAYCRMEFTELLNYNISFDWQCNGESTYDYLRAFLVPTSADPDFSAGNEIANGHTETPNGWIDINNGRMNQAGREWMHADTTMIIEPGLYYLVFYWRNDDGAGDNPPAAVDNIRIVKITCPSVTNIAASDITIESATLTWTEIGSAESWDIIVSETELSDTDLETYNNFTTVSSPSYSATGLEQAHTYYVYVRAACSSDEKSGWASGVFSSAFCTAVDMCSIRYELEDSYGDGWNDNTLNVVDASTDEVLASWTIEDGSSMEGTLAVCNGRDIRFEYVGDNYPDETSYRVYDVNDDLIFEGSDKFTDPIHYMMSCSSCLSVANLAITEIAAQSATISWGDRNSAETWEVIVSDQNLSGPELDGATVQTLTDSTYSLSSLTPTTIYYVYVRSVCSAEEKSGWKSLTFRTTQVPAQIPYSCGFEDESENSIWTLNAGAINGWYVGEAAYNEGSKGFYVSNDSGETNSYDTGSETSIYAYRTLNIPELCYYSVSFDWMANGESSYDYLRAFLVPASLNADLSSGVQNGISETATPANWIELYSNGGKMNGLDLWQTNTIEVALEQGLYNLVFYWRNDNGGGEIPPAAIDNISVTKLVPFRLSAQVQPGWGSTSATLEGNIDFLGEVQTLTAGFEFGVDNTHFADSVPVVSSDGTFSHEFTGLEAQTTYYYRGFVIYNDEPIYSDIAQFKTRNNDNGTESSPLIIESESDWGEFVTAIQNGAGFGADAMGEYKGSEIVDGAFGMYFKIGNDFTLTSSNITVNGFKGILLGDGKTITLDNSAGYGTDFKGLFSSIYNATIDSLNISLAQSITIPSPETSDNNGFGLLCSEVYSSSVISDCMISGGEGILLNCNDVRFGAGALVGSVNDATITNCTNNLDVDGYYVAGIAGLMKGGTISKCTNNAAIKSETEGYYVGGIVYSIEGNVQSTITECLNTGALTSGGIAGGIVARINGSNSTISKCMNIGQITTNYTDWSTGEYAGGIVGGSRMSSTITNNANYGSFGRLSSNIGGIAGNNMTSLSKNVSAPVYLSENIAGNSSYNIFATMSVGVDNYETANEEDDDFFDEQIGDIKVDSLRLRFASQATAMPTSDLVGSALSGSLSSENWIFTNGLYPMPAGIPESPKTTVARIPMYLAENETVFGVMSNFTVPTTISGQTVEWTSSSPDVIAISDGSATVTRPASGEADVDVTLTATCQGETKSFIVRVIGPKQVPVLTEGATVGTSVILNGEFSSDAEGIITYTKEYGFKYGKESDLSDAVNLVSTNLGIDLHESTRFTAVINDFDDSKYYYAAYATTADATTLGEIKSFKKSTAPEVIAKYPMWRTNSEATIEFDITLNEGEEFYGVESAFYYGTESNNLNLTGIINYDDDYGYYSTDLSNLTADTKYYYVAEVANDLGTTRSDTLEFLTCGTMTDSRDGTQYYTIRIGNQTWMAQNLKYAGNIPQGSETSSTDAYRYNPDDFSDAVDEYGYLYNWAAAMNGENPTNENPSSVQGICPSGWHLPSDAEWTQLTDYLGGTENAGVLLAGQPAAQDRYWQTSDMTMSVNFGKSGFNALPAGYYVGTNYSSFGSGTGFWSATENTSEYAYVRSIYYESTSMDRNYDNKVKGNSVRCVKGSVVYAYDTLPYCGESYTYHDTVITASGDYTVRIQNGETENIYKLHLTLYPALVPTISSYSNGCYGENNGYVEVGVSGGAGTYTYNWSTPDMQTDARLSNLADGEYTVTVTDAAGCSATISQTIVTPGELTVTVSGDNQICEGDNASLTATVEGGTPDYTYAWTNEATTESTTVQTTGTYIVTVTDDASCTATGMIAVTVNPAATLELTSGMQDQNLCYGETLTTIVFTYGGGANGASVSGLPTGMEWNTDANAHQILISGTPTTAGTYDYTITTTGVTSPCTNITITGTITVYQQLTATVSGNNPDCYGDQVTLTATPDGGSAPYNYNWSNNENSISITDSPLSTTTYTVTITDANGCTATAFKNVVVNSQLTVSISGDTQVQCYGNLTASLTATASGGSMTMGYSYNWSNSLEGQTISTLGAGNYSVTVTDGNGCNATSSVTVTGPDAALSISISATNTTLTCSNTSATITATVTGGTEDYTYNWSNSGTNNTSEVTTPGSYTVVVTDANGCSVEAAQTITEDKTAPTVTIDNNETELNCNRTSITLTATGSDASYVWSNGGTNAATTVTTPDTYTVTATGDNGCTNETSVTITKVENPTIDVTASEILCYGATTTFTANVSNGAAPYSYSWQDDLGSSQTLSAQAGTYSVTVTDSNSCTASASGTANQPEQLTASVTKTDVLCNGASNGTATVTVEGGTDPYTYVWSDNADRNSNTATGLATGNYSVTVSDSNGCSTTVETTIDQPSTLTASASAEAISCYGGTTTATVAVNGGIEPYTYVWSDNADRNSNTASDITAGTYSVTVTDANGCSADAATTITEPDELTVSLSATEILCNGGTTTVTAAPNGGTSPYAYAWQGNSSTESSLSGVAGTYSVTVTDNNGCSATESTTVSVNDQTAPELTGTWPSNITGQNNCFANADINELLSDDDIEALYEDCSGLTVSHNDANTSTDNCAWTITRTYTIQDTYGNAVTPSPTMSVSGSDQTGPTIGDDNLNRQLTSTNCTFTVPDLTSEVRSIANDNCTANDDLTITQNPTAGTEITTATTVTVTVTDQCGNSSTKEIELTLPNELTTSLSAGTIACNGGTAEVTNTVTGGTEPYQFAWNNDATTQDLTGVSGGTYSVTVTDANNCTASASATVNEPDQLTSTLSAGTISCHGGTADVTNTVTGGTEPYQFAWSNDETSQSLEGVRGGTYSVTVTDANSCSATATTTVIEPDQLTSILSAGTIACNGGTTDITNTVSGGTEPFTFEWSNDATTQNLTGVGAGTYEVFVRDANGCVVSQHIDIEQPDALTTLLSAGTIACNGGTTDIINTVSGGTPDYQYFWTDDTHNQNNEGVSAGNYSVTVQDANGCSATASIEITQPNVLTSTLSAGTISCHGGTADVTNTVTGGTEPYQFAWSNEATTQSLEGVRGGTYSVTITDANSCSATATTTVNEPDQLTSILSAGTIDCNGGTTDITNSVSGGTEPITYEWSNDANTQNLTGVGAGTYEVFVRDANGCVVSQHIDIEQPDVLTASLTAGTVSCNGGTTNITSTVNGGTPNFTYAWSNEATTDELTGVGAGTYSVTVTDANTCTASAIVTITQPNALSVSISGPTSVCENTTSTLTANVQGGTADFTYLWSNSATTVSITTPQLAVATEYSVTVTDANDCSATASVNVEIGDTPGISISEVTPICVGGNKILQANVSNAGDDYTLEWSSTDTNAGLPADITTDAITVTPTTAGSYTYTVSLTATSCSDGQPFTSSDFVTLTVNSLPDAAITNSTNETTITCTTTEISLTATGGNTYAWSNGVAIADNNVTSAATYTVTVTDANECSNTASITISEDVAAPIVSITNNTGTTLLTCTTTTINVEATGDDASYLWSNEVTTATNAITTSGTYTVTATADNGCTSTAAIEITPNDDVPTVSITNNTGETELTCALTSISVTATGSGTSYQWSGGASTEEANNTFTAPGTYIVTATAGNGCSASDQITITRNIEAPEISASATANAICQGESTTISATGGQSYTWSPDTGLPTTVGSSITASPTTTITYTVTGVGENGCNGTAEVTVTVNQPNSSEFAATACDSYEWNGTTYDQTGDYTHTFTNANGCDSVVTLHLTINNSQTNIVDISACESYEWAGETYTETGEYNHTFTAANGCDSVVTLHLTINQPVAHEITETACEMFTWNGTDYNETGDYTGTFIAANGCDSIVTLHLTINNATTGVDTQVACNSYTWIDGNTYTESTDAPTFTLTNANGCDSVVTLHLTINYSTTGEFADQMCSGVPYTYEGQTFTEAGTYQVTLTNAHGCDSIVTLTLTYANNCSGLVSGVITDENTGYAIPNAKVTIGNRVTRTNAEGQYSLSVIRGLKALRVSATGYISYSRTVDIQSDTTFNASLNAPQIHTDTDSILVSSYPYLEQSDSVSLSNNGNGTLVWSSITEYDNLELVEDSTIQRRNTRSLWDSIQTFATRENAEQAIATDGFFIYTASWMRPGEFNRYTPNGEYVETFYVENVGSIRNLSYDGTYFYGTEATNIIFKIDLDNQTLVDSIETDIPEIRHCSFNRQDGSLLAGSWNSLYRIDTASGTSQQIRDNLANVYSSAFDNLSAGGPYLWLFSQTSQNNGPSACIRQFNISTGEYTGKTHYLDDINLTNSSLAGGICASEYVCEGKFVLLADVQNPAGSNTIATYEIGRTNNVVKTGKKSGTIEPNGSESISVKANATATGDYIATIKYRAAVMGRQSNDINVSISAIAPECEAVQQISIVTDTFHTVTLDWQPVELGDYDNVSYFVYNSASQYPIDTLSGTTVTYDGLPVGEHCFYVRALSSSNYTCLSEASDTVCAEIQNIPCNVSLIVEARTDGEAITISWNKPVGVTYFNIYKYGESLAEHLTSTTFVDTDVEPETDYCYIIIAHFENGICDEISATVCTRIAGDGCAEAPVLTAEALGAYVALEWTGNGALSYSVFRDNEFIGTTDGLSYMDNVPESGNYCYRVESTCEYGMYNSSNEACVSVEVNGDGDAIEEWSADNLTLYPNPTYGHFFIEGQRIAVVQIFNASGQLVSEIENTEDEHITINCESWNPGIYNVRIISAEGETATRKVTIFR